MSNLVVVRLEFLLRVVTKELAHLQYTNGKLFAQPFSLSRAEKLLQDADFAEQVEAFVSRFNCRNVRGRG